jgi:hypothetical protein
MAWQLNSGDSKGVVGHHLEKGVSNTDHVDLARNLEAK